MTERQEPPRVAQPEREAAQHRAQLPETKAAPQGGSRREWLFAEAERVARLGSWVWDLPCNEVYWSDGLYRILGLDRASVPASTEAFFSAVHPDDRARVRAASKDPPGPIDCRIVRPSGEIRAIHLLGEYSDGPDGPRTQIVGTVLDETDKKLAAAQLAQTVAELNEAQQVANLGSWRWSLANGRVDWSEGMYRVLGVDLGRVPTEQLFYRHVHPDDLERVRAAEVRAVDTGIALEIEFRIVRGDGLVRLAVMRSRGIFDEGGALTGFQGILQDISEHKALEEAARHAQKMEAVGTLAGGVAHDFNNYLMVLSGNLDLLADGLAEGGAEARALEAIRHACDRCVNLTAQLLTLSRKHPPKPASFDLGQRVQALGAVLRSALGATIELHISVEPNTPPIHADPLQIEHALMNLALNARDGMAQGGTLSLRVEGVVVESAARAELAAGYYVRLSVRDTGCGIPCELHSRIFEPFFTTKAVGKGTGLGLAMVYGIVRDAGGGIEVESQQGEGTTFHLYFRPAQDRELAPAAAQPRDDGEVRGQGQRILLVEDVQLVRELLRDQLQAAGYEVLTAADGVAALGVLASLSRMRAGRQAARPVDGLISDVVMPNMGGIELLRIVREQFPSLPCMLMSGYAPAVLGEPNNPPTATLLRKPFSGRELCHAVADLLAGSTEPQL
ncbi:MAG TPA: PAS domain-containing protein [Polyangiales bacterium]